MKKQSVLWGIIVVLVCSVIALAALVSGSPDPGGVPAQPGGEGTEISDDRIVATIGGEEITYEQLLSVLEQEYGRLGLRQLLTRMAIDMESEASGIQVSDAEVDRELGVMQQGYDSEEQFYQSMRDQLGMTRDQIRNDLRYRILLEKIAIQSVIVHDQEIDEYIADHPEEFGPREQWRLSQITVRSKADAEEVLARIRSGTEFAEAAKRYSMDEMTSEDGGDLGFVERDDPFVPEAVLETAEKLKLGEVSGPIPVDDYYVLIMVTERIEDIQVDDRQMREMIRRELALSRAKPLREIERDLLEKRHAAIVDAQFRL